MTVLASLLRNVLSKAIVGGLEGAFSPHCEILRGRDRKFLKLRNKQRLLRRG
jgi:hypothetical protein